MCWDGIWERVRIEEPPAVIGEPAMIAEPPNRRVGYNKAVGRYLTWTPKRLFNTRLLTNWFANSMFEGFFHEFFHEFVGPHNHETITSLEMNTPYQGDKWPLIHHVSKLDEQTRGEKY